MTDQRGLWSIRVDETQAREALQLLDAQLVEIGESWAGALRFKVAAKLAAQRRAMSGGAGASFAVAYGLPAPDGRWLHCYRLSDEAFARLQQDLVRSGGLDALALGNRPGLFVLWASEWFRRSYLGGGQRWEDLASVLGIPADQTALRSITDKGLRQWRREVIEAGNFREYLGSLAREGGFPTKAVEEGGGGWAREVLSAIVSPLAGEAQAGEERALELAGGQRHRLPILFRDDAFVQLCADLALAIVKLRREAEPAAAAKGIPVLAWLQLNRPEWRDALPLTTSEAAATALIEGLMTVEAVTGGAVGVDRLLVRAADGGWYEAARITLDGLIDSTTMRTIPPSEGRLRAFAAGEMARAIPGELAMLEPPAQGETRWTARASRRGNGILRVPLAAAIELDLRAGEQSVRRIALAGGKPRRGRLLVALLDTGSNDAPQSLRVVGAGSGKYRAADLYLQTPLDWSVDATGGETVTPIGAGVGQTSLWRVQGGAFVTDSTGDRYRVLCGQPDDVPAKIELIGTSPGWANIVGDVDLFVGAPFARTSRSEGSLFVRPIGARDWRPAPGTLPIGHYELGWRDNRVLLDRRRVAVLPATAALGRSGSGRDVQYEPSGFGSVAIRPASDAPVSPSSDGTRWISRHHAEAVYRFNADILWDDAPSLTVSIEYPCAAAIAHWDGRVLPDRAQITLDQLGDLVAINRGPMQLIGEMHDPQTRARGAMRWDFIDELPMTSIAADIASLLLPVSIDATVKLGMHDGIETYWHVRQFETRLEKSAGGIVARQGIIAADAELCGRSLADPSNEVRLGAYSLLSDANHRPIALPDDIGGTWLLFLRAGGRILSRPLLIFGSGPVPVAQTPLTRAMMLGPRDGLDAALAEVLQAACLGDAAADQVLGELLDLIASLRGLPPATFRILDLLPHHPVALTRLAMLATPDQRDAVLALSDGLPFAWCAIRRTCWDDAVRIAFERAFAQLATLGDQGVPFAAEMVGAVRAAIIAREPLLTSVLLPVRGTFPIAEIAQAFLNRSRERIGAGLPERYRAKLGQRLPEYFLRFPEDVLDTLDAPCAAALAVSGAWAPKADDIRHIKTVARTFPTYFADAFAATLKELS